MNKSRRYNKLLCTLLLAFVGVVNIKAGTIYVVRPDKASGVSVAGFGTIPLTRITFTGMDDAKGAGISISGTDFDHWGTSSYYYGYCTKGSTFTVTFTNFRYQVIGITTRVDRGNITVSEGGEGDYRATSFSEEYKDTHISMSTQLDNSYYEKDVNCYSKGLESIVYTQSNGSSGTGNGKWLFFGSGSSGFLQINYEVPVLTQNVTKTIHKGNTYDLIDSDIFSQYQGAFTLSDITFSSSDESVASVSGTTITAKEAGRTTITATLKNNGVEVTSTTFTVTVDKYALTTDNKNVHVYGSPITDEDITGAHTFLGNADNVNALVYVENGSYTGSTSNVVVRKGNAYTCADLNLKDSKTASLSVPIAFTASKVTYERLSSTGKWNTIYLPYAPIKKDGYTYYVLSAADLTAGKLTFTEISGDLAANTPYLIKNTTGANIDESSDESKSISVTTGTSGDATTLAGWSMNGVYERTTFFKDDQQTNYSTVTNTKKIDANSYYIKSDGSGFVVNKDYFNLSAFRGYFSAGTSGGAKATFLTFSTEDTPTAINMVEKNDGTVDMIFDLSGRKLSNAKKGSINIINGKKILVK